MMAKKNTFKDGLKSLTNSLANRRSGTATNTIFSQMISFKEMNEIYKTGIGSKIVRLKISHALDDTLEFENTRDEAFYKIQLSHKVKQASKWMLAFGRGIIVIHEDGADLEKPLPKDLDLSTVTYHVFSGDMVTVPTVDRELGRNYWKPQSYVVRSFKFHPSRVIDFTYVPPIELESPSYQYGGISEFELIRPQLVADAIVERASATILEKNSTVFYKYAGFKETLEAGQDKNLLEYFTQLENVRSIYGAGIIDAEDDVMSVDQHLTNLVDTDMITLRRLAMVTGIPVPVLVGENVKGLNSSGDNEKKSFQDMIETLQFDFLLEPINQLMLRLGKDKVHFKENQGRTPDDRINFETKAIQNAVNLQLMGEDAEEYLIEKEVIKPTDASDIFKPVDDQDEAEEEILTDEA